MKEKEIELPPGFVRQPELQDIKRTLESRFLISLHATTFRDSPWDAGTHSLTQYGPVYIGIRWSAQCAEEYRGYFLTIAKSESSRPIYQTGYTPEPLENVIREISRHAKPRLAEQMKLF